MTDKGQGGGLPILADPFRPFFLGAVVFALFAVPVWVWLFSAPPDLPAGIDPRAWHIHEMLFGYLAAVMTGFLFTAIPNWTGRLPLRGWGLGGLVLLWLAGRVTVAFWPQTWIAGVVDPAFLVVIAALVWREIHAGRNWRNAPVCTLISLFALANILFHVASSQGVAERLGLGVAAVLIGLVGGRVTPSFTHNWLVKAGASALPAPFGLFDKLALLLLIAAIVLWVVVPFGLATGGVLLAAALVHAIRLVRWRGWLTVSEPLLLILHLGYGWLALAMFYMACAAAEVAGVEQGAALHALAVGAIGTMTLGVMARATLGHSGRAVAGDWVAGLMVAAITLSAALRVAAPDLPIDTPAAIAASGLMWCLAFGLFLAAYGPILMTASLKKSL